MKKFYHDFDLDDPRATLQHKNIILEKPFLKKVYSEWYSIFQKELESVPPGKILEIGSGGGFFKEKMPEVITSDILELECCDMCFSAEKLPFNEEDLSGIVMLNVFHHIPRPYKFLEEAERVLKSGGKVVMIEPANSWLGRFIYKRFHHEPFNPEGQWEIESKGPLSDSNQALPYIYFERDRNKFENKFKRLKISEIKYHSPLKYLLSGGLSRPSFLPFRMYGLIKFTELLLTPFNRILGLFVLVVIQKK